ncbi:MAG: hypothetical protein A2148_10685 [Chloroflexi bacterium RBG_16_68_14]|nr:MAG: hypothetical protein A2148_10685 [Chloroflexi bacterium RBG_16_68_14]
MPREHLARLTFVVPLAVAHRDGRVLRRVREVSLFGRGDRGLQVRRIAAWDERRDAFSALEEAEERAALAERLGLKKRTFDRELVRREAFLQRLMADGVAELDAVQEAVEAFRNETAE